MAEPESVGLGALAVGVLIDGSLAAEALSLRFAPVANWLEAHELALLWSLGPLHALVLPIMFLLPIARQCPASDLLFLDRDDPESKLFPWLVVLSLCAGFMVPLLGIGARQFPGPAWLCLVIAGPLLGVFGGGWLLVKFDKKEPTNPKMSPIERGTLALLAWLYFAELEAVLFLAAGFGDSAMQTMVVPALLLAYLPIRLFFYYSRSTRRWELVSIFAALLLMTGQLLSALPAG